MGRSNEKVNLAKKKGYKFTKQQLIDWGLKFHKLNFIESNLHYHVGNLLKN